MSTAVPYDFSDASRAIAGAKARQEMAEQQLRTAWKDYAAAERAYRSALAQEILRLKADGVAWSSTQDLARGEKKVADLKYSRDVAEGMREAAAQAVFRHTADRRELEQLISWSMRVSPDGQYEQSPVRGTGVRAA